MYRARADPLIHICPSPLPPLRRTPAPLPLGFSLFLSLSLTHTPFGPRLLYSTRHTYYSVFKLVNIGSENHSFQFSFERLS